MSPVSPSLSLESGVIDTGFLLRELKRKQWLILRCAVAVALIAMLFALKQKPPEISATLRVDPPSNQGISLGNLYNVDTEIGSLRSYSNVQEVLKSLQYLGQIIPTASGGMAPSPAQQAPAALEVSRLSFPPVMHGRYWQIVVTGPDHYELQTQQGNMIARGRTGVLLQGHAQSASTPQKAGQYHIQIDAIHAPAGSRFMVQPESLSTLTKHVLSKLDITKRSSSPGSNLLDIKLALHDSALAKRIVTALAQNYIQNSFAGQTAAPKQAVARLQQSTNELKEQMQQSKQALLHFYASTKAIAPQVQAHSLLQQRIELQNKLKAAQIKLSQLEVIYTAKHPAISATTSEIDLLETSLQQLNATILVLPTQESQLKQLEGELNIHVQLYQNAVKELARAKLEMSRIERNVHLIDAPRLKEHNRLKYLAQLIILGGMLGFIIGLATVLLGASLKLGRLYALSQLAPLTSLSVNQAMLRLKAGQLLATSAQQLSQLVNYHYSHAPSCQLIACTAQKQQRRSAALTLAFAKELAKHKRVLLIDAHLYQSPLAALLDNSNRTGFSNWLSGRAQAHEVIHKARSGMLSVMPAGQELLNYDLLRDGSALSEKLAQLHGFDAIVIYLPPASALGHCHALLERCQHLIHWVELYTSLTRLLPYLQPFEALTQPRQNIFVYEHLHKRAWFGVRKHKNKASGAANSRSHYRPYAAHKKRHMFID